MRNLAIVCVATALLGLAGCCKSADTGTCEYKFDEASRDNSIPKGQEVCMPDWEAKMCNVGYVNANNLSVGYKTSGYKFSKGATCESKGYKDCRGTGMYNRTCDGK